MGPPGLALIRRHLVDSHLWACPQVVHEEQAHPTRWPAKTINNDNELGPDNLKTLFLSTLVFHVHSTIFIRTHFIFKPDPTVFFGLKFAELHTWATVTNESESLSPITCVTKTNRYFSRAYCRLHVSRACCWLHVSRACRRLYWFPALTTCYIVFPRLTRLYVFPPLQPVTLFSRVYRRLHVSRALPPVTLDSRAYHLLHCFPALGTGYMFSRAKSARLETRSTYLRKARKRSRSSILLFLSSLNKFPSKISCFSIVSQVRFDVVVNLKKRKKGDI